MFFLGPQFSSDLGCFLKQLFHHRVDFFDKIWKQRFNFLICDFMILGKINHSFDGSVENKLILSFWFDGVVAEDRGGMEVVGGLEKFG